MNYTFYASQEALGLSQVAAAAAAAASGGAFADGAFPDGAAFDGSMYPLHGFADYAHGSQYGGGDASVSTALSEDGSNATDAAAADGTGVDGAAAAVAATQA